jgi:hypothetical protein
MSLLDKSKANYAFKSLLGKSHTSNNRELYNEAIPSGIILTGSRIFGNDINSNPTDPSNTGIVSDLITLVLEPVLGSDTVVLGTYQSYRTKLNGTVPASLVGKTNPLTKLAYAPNDYVGNLIPQSFGDNFRPLLFSDAAATVEIPPSSSADWFIDCFAGIVTQEGYDDGASFVLGNNGRVKAYVYIGQFISQTIQASGSKPTLLDKNMTPLNVAGSNGVFSGLTITNTPISDGYVEVTVNGIVINLGTSSSNGDGYFAQPSSGGTIGRNLADIQAGDEFYWNSILALYPLDNTDSVSFNYNVGV